jgi:hypothetical protein
MGMFDYINCERRLPLNKEAKKAFKGKDWSEENFQTKSLSNTMEHYCITKRGLLTILKIDGEHVRTMTEEEEKKARKQKRFCWPYKFVETSRIYEKHDYTGVIDFYYYSDDEEGNTWDLEFKATFIKGKLTDLVLDSGKIITTAEENEANEKRWQNKLDAYEAHPWTKTKKVLNKITFGYWTKFWSNYVSRSLYWVAQKTQKLQLWVIRNLA